MPSLEQQTSTSRGQFARAMRIGLGALLTGIPLAVVRSQLLEHDPNLVMRVWVLVSALFPAWFFFILTHTLPSKWWARFLLATATTGYLGPLLLHHLYYLGRGGVPHLRQVSQLPELSGVGPLLLPLFSVPTVLLVLVPLLGIATLRHSAFCKYSALPRCFAFHQPGRARLPLAVANLALWALVLSLSSVTATVLVERGTGATVDRLRIYEPNQMAAKLGLSSYWYNEVIELRQQRRHSSHHHFPGTVRELLNRAEVLSASDAPSSSEASLRNTSLPAAPTQQNLIWIQLESLDPDVVEGSKGRRTMPFLHHLSQQEVYFPNFWAQHSGGGTSDAELASLTSLLPLATHAGIQTLDPDNHLAMPQLLADHGYQTLAFHGYRPSYYGRNEYLPKIGFSSFSAGRELTGKPAKLPLQDQPMFDAALKAIESTTEPFFALIITVQGHGPHADENAYLQQMSAVDRALEVFIAGLRSNNLLQRTTVFLYSDHLSTPNKSLHGKERIPLIILSPQAPSYSRTPSLPMPVAPQTLFDASAPASHLDLAPTALALLGIQRPSGWLGDSLVVDRLVGGRLVGEAGAPVVLFNDLSTLRTRTGSAPRLVRQPNAMPALLYSLSQLTP